MNTAFTAEDPILTAKVRTRRTANGTYEWTYTGAGDWFPTQALTSHGARYQGNRFLRGQRRLCLTSPRKGYTPEYARLEGTNC